MIELYFGELEEVVGTLGVYKSRVVNIHPSLYTNTAGMALGSQNSCVGLLTNETLALIGGVGFTFCRWDSPVLLQVYLTAQATRTTYSMNRV